MTLEQAVEKLHRLPAEKQVAVARLIELLAGSDVAEASEPIPSWGGILKGCGPVPTCEDLEEARRECWNFDRESDPK